VGLERQWQAFWALWALSGRFAAVAGGGKGRGDGDGGGDAFVLLRLTGMWGLCVGDGEWSGEMKESGFVWRFVYAHPSVRLSER
jgi:hypothetical protein